MMFLKDWGHRAGKADVFALMVATSGILRMNRMVDGYGENTLITSVL